MRSAAHLFQDHPIHPMLIPFPIAFLAASAFCDLVAQLATSHDAFILAYYLGLAGVITAVLAAIPGFMDFSESVPPLSAARTVAKWHLVVNSGVILIFGVAWGFKDPNALAAGWPVTLAEWAGAALLGLSGYLGGTLAYRFQIGVAHEYANSGQWRELTIPDEFGSALRVASPGELTPGQMKLLRLQSTDGAAPEKRSVLARTDQGYVAFEDRCTHQGGSLADGTLARGCVQCPWHGSQFDTATGQNVSGPADRPIKTYPVRQLPDRIELAISSSNSGDAGSASRNGQ